MLALNIALMTALGLTIMSLLTWAIRSGRDPLQSPVARPATRIDRRRAPQTLTAAMR